MKDLFIVVQSMAIIQAVNTILFINLVISQCSSVTAYLL